MTTKPRGEGVKALVVGPLNKELFFAASLNLYHKAGLQIRIRMYPFKFGKNQNHTKITILISKSWYFVDFRPDSYKIAVSLWYLVKTDLSSVRFCTPVH